MKRILFSVFIILTCLTSVCYSQDESIEKANELYENLAYAEAIPIYNYYYEQGDISVVPNLADCYDKLDDLFNAVDLYNQLVNSEYVEPKDQLRYGMLLMEFQQYAEAKNWLTKYADSNPGDVRAQNLIEACNKIYSDFPNNNAVEIERLPMPVNSNKSEMGTAVFKNGFIFSSDRDSLVLNNKSKSTNRQFYDLYFASKSKNKWSSPTKIKGANTVTRFHEGPIALFNNETEMYFTRNNYEEERFSIFGKRGYDKNGVTRLKIYHARLKSGKWVTTDKLPFNNNEYSVAHPATNNAGDVVYFSSDKEGGFGGLDLYKIEFDGSNWSQPKNMGAKVNTEGNEVFPYYHNEEDRLYFSSDGHVGIGGADIFMIEDEEVLHLGRPINSAGDDFGISFSADKSFGFFTSNRSQRTNGDDDIYYFTNTKTIEVKPLAIAVVPPKATTVNKKNEPVKTAAAVKVPKIEVQPTACQIKGVLLDVNNQPALNGYVSLQPDGIGKKEWKEVDESGAFQFETWSNLTYTLSCGLTKSAMETTRIIENSCLDKEYEMTLLSANKKPEIIALKVIDKPVVKKPEVKKPIIIKEKPVVVAKVPAVKKPVVKKERPVEVAKVPVVKKPKIKATVKKKKPIVVAKVPVIPKPTVVAKVPAVSKPKVKPSVTSQVVKPIVKCRLSVKVLDANDAPAEKTFVTLLNDKTGVSKQVKTDLNGYFLFDIFSNATYRVTASRNVYSAEVTESITNACEVAGENNTVQLKLRSKNPEQPIVANPVKVTKRPVVISKPKTLDEKVVEAIKKKEPIVIAKEDWTEVVINKKDKPIIVKNTAKPAAKSFVKKLYWPNNEYLLDDEAKVALNEVVDEMLFNPIAKLSLTAYTPAGQDEVVAKRRTGIIIQHLLEKGISFDRVERKLESSNVSFSNCGNDFDCIEEQRKVSSRTEIQIK